MEFTDLAGLIDHTCLKPDTTSRQIEILCREALENNFFAVCIPPAFVRAARKHLGETAVRTCTVVGFPLGFNTTETKCFEARAAVEDGAQEIDMVINIGALKEGRHAYVEQEINMVSACIPENIVLKVIIETACLTGDQKKTAAQIILNTNAHFVKTSTGFASGGATVEDVTLLRNILGNAKKIKAAGGIRTPDQAYRLVQAGAARLGCSNSLKIIKGL